MLISFFVRKSLFPCSSWPERYFMLLLQILLKINYCDIFSGLFFCFIDLVNFYDFPRPFLNALPWISENVPRIIIILYVFISDNYLLYILIFLLCLVLYHIIFHNSVFISIIFGSPNGLHKSEWPGNLETCILSGDSAPLEKS